MNDFLDFEHGIHAVDALFKRPRLAALHLIVEGGRAALVECGTNHSLVQLQRLLDHCHVSPEAVDYVIVTHVHLDHAGGAGAIMRHLPNARLVVHPRGVRHMADPGQLYRAATAVYGEAEMRATYGELLPVPRERMLETRDGELIELNGRPLLFLHTPGHCRHHHCLYDERSGGMFTGDTFGISYREFDVDGRPAVVLAAAPSQFDPIAFHESIERLRALRPRWAFLTHYSRVGDVDRLADTLHKLVDGHVAVAESNRGLAGPERHQAMAAGLDRLFRDHLHEHGCRLPEADVTALIALDVEVNAQGLGVWLDSA